ncbi:MAG TPA: hypothetical protein DEG17_08345 [Cyanobacteria bacterium UBA11149]|nr:hypothetical protein [Cyanobacteria bacterium UBA11166]HBR73038.1 hypothetical protein [Cyanobacteria bacterium UBA11159]HBW88869.1 hypothetical protein [Cyanobacteria bacterium UBA11149]HCA97032.1 hypothetical protein [Cyanobacteria bacterium UBA9226]
MYFPFRNPSNPLNKLLCSSSLKTGFLKSVAAQWIPICLDREKKQDIFLPVYLSLTLTICSLATAILWISVGEILLSKPQIINNFRE